MKTIDRRHAVPFALVTSMFLLWGLANNMTDTLLAAFKRIMNRDFSDLSVLPRRIQPITLLDRGVMRAGMPVYRGEKQVGWVTSGTMVPYYVAEGEGLQTVITDETAKRAVFHQRDQLVNVQAKIRQICIARQAKGLDLPAKGGLLEPFHALPSSIRTVVSS